MPSLKGGRKTRTGLFRDDNVPYLSCEKGISNNPHPGCGKRKWPRLSNAHSRSCVTSRPYVFADANAYMSRPNPFQTGIDLLAKGNVKESILAFEAEVQKNSDNSDAWLSLGLAHAENDEDIKAIIALNRAVNCDPENLDALLALGVSHTNELEQSHALRHLRDWITRHPQHRGAVPPAAADQPGKPSHELQREVVQMFEAAARARPDDGEIHTVLGVLYNLSYEYPRAVESFREALRVNPSDYAMWNKLGATLANSMRCPTKSMIPHALTVLVTSICIPHPPKIPPINSDEK